MTFSQSVNTCFSKYCSFRGRPREVNTGGGIVSHVRCRDHILAFHPEYKASMSLLGFQGLPVISYVVGALLLLPNLGVLIRRLHDTGRSGWWWLIGFIPFLGSIILIVFYLSGIAAFPQSVRCGAGVTYAPCNPRNDQYDLRVAIAPAGDGALNT